MKIKDLNETLSVLFGDKIELLELKDQTAKKWYEKSYVKPVNQTFTPNLIYGVLMDGSIEFDFSVKNMDNLFKSFFNNYITKYKMKKLNFDTGENYTRSEAQQSITSNFLNVRLSKGIMYSTDYGIGVWYIYMPPVWIANNCIAIEKRLSELNINYYNEFSDARWVFRYKFDGNHMDHNLIIESINI